MADKKCRFMSATIRKQSNGGTLLQLSFIWMPGEFVVLSLVKNNIDVHVEKGASYYKQYYNQQPEKSRDISRGQRSDAIVSLPRVLPFKISLPKNETTVNLKSVSFVIIMHWPEGLSHIQSQIKSRLLFAESFTLKLSVSGVSTVRTMTTDREAMLLQSHSAAFLKVFIWSSFVTCLHLYNQKPRNPKETSLNLIWGPDSVDSCTVKLKSTLQRWGWRLIDTSLFLISVKGRLSVHAASHQQQWDQPSSFDHRVIECLRTEDVRNSDSNSDRLWSVFSHFLWAFLHHFFMLGFSGCDWTAAVSECVELCCFLLLQRALLHPLLLALSMLTFITDPLLPERLDVQPVVDQSHVHLQQHNTDNTDSAETLPFIVIWKVLKSTSSGDATGHRAAWRRKYVL